MNYLTKKDWAIIVLFFLFVLVATSFPMLIDESPLEPNLPWHLAMLFVTGFVLIIPIGVVTMPIAHVINALGIGTSYDFIFQIMPWLAAFFYSILLMLGLAMYNKSKKSK